MKHAHPPENLPVIPEEEAKARDAAPEAVHFRDPWTGDTLKATHTEGAAQGGRSGPAPRSLQSNDSDMAQTKRRPIRAPGDLLNVDDMAARLLLSRAAIYRLVSRKALPVYRLPGGIRFKEADVDAFLESRRSEADIRHRHGGR